MVTNCYTTKINIMSTLLRFILKSTTLILFLLLFFIGNFNGIGQSSIPFKELAKNSPYRYHTIARVIKNKELRLSDYYSPFEKGKDGSIGKAWKKVKAYFPKKFYYTDEETYFMMHQFTSGVLGKVTVYESAEFKKANENFPAFTDRGIVNHFNKIKNNEKALNEFKKKLGLLWEYFKNTKSKRFLKSELGKDLYNEMLKSLREEGDHIFAAALLHEGMHAAVGAARKANKIDKDFKACNTPVQWDELRGYMAEMQYHFNYYKLSQAKIDGQMSKINGLLAKLEKFRGLKKPLEPSKLKAIEKLKLKIKARIAMIRVSLREMQQSLDRMKSLIAFFKKQKYVKDTAPQKYKDMVKSLETKLANFAKEVQAAIAGYEKGLKSLEDMLNAWNKWARCETTDPPTEEEHKKAKKEFKDVSWPTSPSTDDEKKIAEEKLAITYNLGPYAVDSSKEEIDKELLIEDLSEPSDFPNADSSKETFSIRSGVEMTNPKLDDLNSYFNYLNDTWGRDIGTIASSTGFWIQVSYHTGDHFSIGIDYVNHAVTSSHEPSSYNSDNTLNTITFIGIYNTDISSDLTLNLSGGIGFNSAEYSETEDTYNIKEKSTDAGFLVSGGLDLRIGNFVGITSEIGYRAAKLSGFDDDVHFFDATNSPVVLDFSGVFTRIGLVFKF